MGIQILAIGCSQPKVCISNEVWYEKFAPKVKLGEHEFSKMVTKGVNQRYYADPEETVVTMATEAIENCVNKSNIDVAEIDLIIHTTNVPDDPQGEVEQIRQAVGAINADCYELTDVACAGSMIAMLQVNAFMKSGRYKNILVSCVANAATRGGNMEDLIASALGDMATAMLFTYSEKESGFLVCSHKTWAEFVEVFDYQPLERGVMAWPLSHQNRHWANNFHLINNKYLPQLHQIVTKFVPDVIEQTLDTIELTANDIQWLITHQAGGVLELWRDLMGFDQKRHLDTFAEVGNCTLSNIPYTMMKALDKKVFSPGDKLLLVSVGSGVHITAAIWQW